MGSHEAFMKKLKKQMDENEKIQNKTHDALRIDLHREIIPNKEKVLAKLTKFKILEKFGDSKYKINRQNFMNIQNSEEDQKNLF